MNEHVLALCWKGNRNNLRMSVNIYMVLLTVCHLLLNISPVITFVGNLPLQWTNQFRRACINEYVLDIGISMIQISNLFIISSYLGLSNSSVNSRIIPSLNCTITITNGEEPKPRSMPIDCWAYLLAILYFLPNAMALSMSAVWKVLSINPRYCFKQSVRCIRSWYHYNVGVRLSDIMLSYKSNIFVFWLAEEITFIH